MLEIRGKESNVSVQGEFVFHISLLFVPGKLPKPIEVDTIPPPQW